MLLDPNFPKLSDVLTNWAFVVNCTTQPNLDIVTLNTWCWPVLIYLFMFGFSYILQETWTWFVIPPTTAVAATFVFWLVLVSLFLWLLYVEFLFHDDFQPKALGSAVWRTLEREVPKSILGSLIFFSFLIKLCWNKRLILFFSRRVG